jgi:hypothetical protein
MKTAKVLRWIAWVFLLGITATVIGAISTSPHPSFARISMTTFFQFGLLNLHLTSARLHAELRATLLGFQFLLGFQEHLPHTPALRAGLIREAPPALGWLLNPGHAWV